MLLPLALFLASGSALVIRQGGCPAQYQHIHDCAANEIPSTPDPTVATTVYNVGMSLGANAVVMLAAFEAAWVESHMNNLFCGDCDSMGVFQQRPSEDWGDDETITDVQQSATEFFQHAIAVNSNYPGLSAAQVAQRVQGSGYPTRYANAQSRAQDLLTDTANGQPQEDDDDTDDDDDTVVDDVDTDGLDDDAQDPGYGLDDGPGDAGDYGDAGDETGYGDGGDGSDGGDGGDGGGGGGGDGGDDGCDSTDDGAGDLC